MINKAINVKSEILHCVNELEDVLKRLDLIGTGIAAIHVDAAIEQLRANVAMSEDHIANECEHEAEPVYARMRIVH